MLPRTLNRCLFTTFFGLLATVVNLKAAEAPRRLSGEIRDQERFTLSGNMRPRLAVAHDNGPVSSNTDLPGLSIHFKMTSQQKADLDQFLREVQSPESQQYHHFLTPEQFGDRFGPNPADVATVTAWLQSQGFTNIKTARSRMFLTFEGSAAQAQTAFQTSIHNVEWNGQNHYANVADPQLPKSLDGFVESIHGLHNFKRQPRGIRRLRPRWTSNLTGSHFLAPGDLATIYNIAPLYQAGYDGTGTKIAVVGQSDVLLSDIQAFRAASGLPGNTPTVIVTGQDPGIQTSSGDEGESDLDLEWTGSIARNASITFVTSYYVTDSEAFAIDNAVAPILSISYGECEADLSATDAAAEAALFAQANAQGITIFAASGDAGAADCDSDPPANYPTRLGLAVDDPASSPYVTGVGGTTLNDAGGTYWNSANDSFGGSALSYIPEVAWNDSASDQALASSGGGASTLNSKPSWQAGPGVPADGARDLPDVAFAASPDTDGYLSCSEGDCVNGYRYTDTTVDIRGGTSVGAPIMAGILALIEQKYGPQGNINPTLYKLAANTTNIFHDITSGNNIQACVTGTPNCTAGTMGYMASPGYDQVTGLGSLDASQLWNQWQSSYPAIVATASTPLSFVPITPCRVADTRAANGAFGGPQMQSGQTREFDLPSGACGIPANAAAYSLNVTAVPTAALGYLSVWPAAEPRPFVSTLNSDGRIKANAAIVPAGSNGGIDVYVTDQTQVILDVDGYFVPSSSTAGLQFFPVAPCRVADTRVATGPLGGPYLAGNHTRDFPVLTSSCNIPSTAQAYSMNVTAVPHAPLLYLTAWPSGQTQPATSTLNALSGTPTANAAIVPAGTNGNVTAFGTADTDVILDVNGYFAPPATGGTYLHALLPCRVSDSRNPVGSLPISGTTTVNVTGSGCQVPNTAQAFVMNATVVPPGPLTYLTLWPSGQTQPFVSTLNADPSTVTSNLAIVTSGGGAVNTYASQSTFVILDISGYFAP